MWIITVLILMTPVVAKADTIYEIFFNGVKEIRVVNSDCGYKNAPAGNVEGYLYKNDIVYVTNIIEPDGVNTYYKYIEIKTSDGYAYILDMYTSEPSEEIVKEDIEYAGQITVTFYGCEAWANGGYHTTCSGIYLEDVVGKIVATNSFPQGTRMFIQGVGYRTVGDTGVNHIDVLVDSENEAYNMGNYPRDVWIIK